MQDDSFLQHFDDKPIVLKDSFAQFSGGANQQVHWEIHIHGQPYPRRDAVTCATVWHHNEQINVGVFRRRAIRVRTKQNDLIRIAQPNDVLHQCHDCARLGHTH